MSSPQPQALVQLPDENQTTARGDPRSLEVDLEKTVERELKMASSVCHPLGVDLHSASIASEPLQIKASEAITAAILGDKQCPSPLIRPVTRQHTSRDYYFKS